MELEERLREILDDGEREALLTAWIDEQGDVVMAVNDTEPHYQIRGSEAAEVEYFTEH